MKKSNIEIPIQDKYSLTISEAAAYSGLGQNKIRDYIKNNKYADFVLWDGKIILIKRVLFEKFLDSINSF